MPVHPEMIPVLAGALRRTLLRKSGSLTDVVWGDAWVALGFRRKPALENRLFLCWDSRNYGCTLAPERDIQALLWHRSAALPIGHAIKAHLGGARLTEIEQFEGDRILRFSFEKLLGAGFAQKRGLLLELTGRYSNCILLDEEDRVLETAKHIHPEDNSYRHILPGQSYTPPPPGNFLSVDEVCQELEQENPEALARTHGMGRPLTRHLIACYNTRSPGEWRTLLKRFAQSAPEERVLQRIKGELSAFPVLLPEAEKHEGKELFSLLWEDSGVRILTQCIAQRKSRLFKKLGGNLKRTRQKVRGMEERERRGEKAEEWKQKGQLLLSYSGPPPKGAASVDIPDWEHPEKTISVPLDPLKSLSANAKRYFEKYKKALAGQEAARKDLEKLRQREEEEDTLVSLLQSCNTTEELQAFEAEIPKTSGKKQRPKKGAPAPKPYLELDLPQFQAHLYVGMNARGNRRVTFDLGKPGDLWLHARNIPGAHVLLRSVRSEHHEEAIALGASLAAYYSKARESLGVPVDYTLVQHVRHIPGSALAHVRYTHFSTFRGEPKSLSAAAAEYAEAPPQEALER